MLTRPASNFVAHYEAETCGDAYEMFNCSVPRVQLPCDDCNTLHYYHLKWLEYRSWDWEDDVDDKY